MGRRNIILICVAICIVVIAFIVAEYRNKKAVNVVYTSAISTSTNISSELLDNNWQAALDKNLPKAAPATNSTKSKEPLTPTDILARDFFARYMELGQTGSLTDAQSQQELIGQILSNGVVLSTPKKYTLSDIHVSGDVNVDALRKYGNDMGAVFKKFYDPTLENEAKIAQDAMSSEDLTILKKIDPIISSYRNILNGLVAVNVPQSMTSIHLDMLNGLNILLFSANAFRKIDVDALGGLQGAKMYTEGAKALNTAFNSLKDSLGKSGIVYNSNEAGYFFIPPK